MTWINVMYNHKLYNTCCIGLAVDSGKLRWIKNIFVFQPLLQLGKIPRSTTDVLLLVCLSLCAGRRLSSHNSTETWVSLHYRWYVVIDVHDNVLRFFAIDHVLVTIATTGAIFSLQYLPKTVWRPGSARTRWGPPDPLAAKQGAYF